MVVVLQSARPSASERHTVTLRASGLAALARLAGEQRVLLGEQTQGKRFLQDHGPGLSGTAEDAHLHRLITKGDTYCVDPLCRALLNRIALVGMLQGWWTALLSHLLSYKCGRHPYSSWANKEKSNFLNAFCWVDVGLPYSTSTLHLPEV